MINLGQKRGLQLLILCVWYVAAPELAYSKTDTPSHQNVPPQQQPVFPRCKEAVEKNPALHIVGGDGADACSFKVPPKSFDPMIASQQDLASWGLPRRPTWDGSTSHSLTFNKQMREWTLTVKQLTNPARTPTHAYACTAKQEDFKGPPEMYIGCRWRSRPPPRPPFLPQRQGALKGEFSVSAAMTTPPATCVAPSCYLQSIWSGYTQTYAERPASPGIDTSVWFVEGAVETISFTNPSLACSGAAGKLLSVASWVGVNDYYPYLDQGGIITDYDCSTGKHKYLLFTEELPDLPSIFTCENNKEILPATAYFVSISWQYEDPLSENGDGYYWSIASDDPNGCAQSAYIPGYSTGISNDINRMSWGQSGVSIVETQADADQYVVAPPISPITQGVPIVSGGFGTWTTSNMIGPSVYAGISPLTFAVSYNNNIVYYTNPALPQPYGGTVSNGSSISPP